MYHHWFLPLTKSCLRQGHRHLLSELLCQHPNQCSLLPSPNTLFMLPSGENTAHGNDYDIDPNCCFSLFPDQFSITISFITATKTASSSPNIPHSLTSGLLILSIRWTSQTPSVLAEHLFHVSVYLLFSPGNFPWSLSLHIKTGLGPPYITLATYCLLLSQNMTVIKSALHVYVPHQTTSF